MKRGVWPLIIFSAVLMQSASAMDVAERMRFADGLYLRGMHDMAVVEYEALLNAAPDFAEMDVVLFRMGESYKRLKKVALAETIYSRLLSEYPDSEYRQRAALRLAELKVNTGAYERAVAMLGALLNEGPDGHVEAAAEYYLGYALVQLGDATRAEKVLREVVDAPERSPFFSFACLELAGLLGDKGKDEEAEDVYMKAASGENFGRVGAEAWFQVAELAFRRGDYATSAKAYEKLLEEYPKDQRVAEARFQAASAYYQSGQFAKALTLTKRVAKGSDEDAAQWLYLEANCQRKLLRTSEALQSYDRLLKEHARSEYAQAAAYEKALISFQEANYEEVVLSIKTLQDDHVLGEDVRWLLAESYVGMHRPALARKQYEEIVRLYPKAERTPEAIHRVARMIRTEGDLQAAAAMYDQLVASYPQHKLVPQALFESAYCKSELGQLEAAIEDWAILVKHHSSSPRAEESLYQKALAEIRLERDHQATMTFTALIRRFPQTDYRAEGHYWIGILHEKAGKTSEAEAAFRKALNLGIAGTWVNKAKYHLAATLQPQGQLDEAAALLQDTVDSDLSDDLPSGLVEWLARYQLDKEQYAAAAQSAKVLTTADREPAWRQIGWYLLGKAQSALGRKKRARTSFKKSDSQDAKTTEGAEAALEWGMLALEQGDPAEAMDAFKRSADRAAGDEVMVIRARSYYGLGRASAALDEWEDAARYFTSVSVLFDDPELVPECLHLGAEALGQLGRLEDMAKTIDELKTRYPDSPWNEGIDLP